jgi:catechol 2,3-dioxygenase-like lactoylglutathione lyase family enzyme
MGLSGCRVEPTIAVSDMARAREFYEGKLCLTGARDLPDGGVRYESGEGTHVHIYPSPNNAGKSPATIAHWDVADTEATVIELTNNGVTFQRYDLPGLRTDERGIATLGSVKVAWFKDPDGNILSVS